MIFQSSEVHQGKRIKVADDDDANNQEAVVVCHHDFWEEAPEDLLLEIFIRLPDSRSAVHTATVCHKWHSLICGNPQFIPRFTSHNIHSPPPSFSVKPNKSALFHGAKFFQPICKLLFSNKHDVFRRRNLFDFLPCPQMVIRASCNDLLLVSPGSCRKADLFVCNPITKKFVRLPARNRFRANRTTGYALVSMPNSQFKVVEIPRPSVHPADRDHGSDSDVPDDLHEQPLEQRISVFCSESRKWQVGSFHYPSPELRFTVLSLDVVRCDGVLYWLEFQTRVKRIVYWDLSGWCGGVIDLPGGGGFPQIAVRIGTVRVRGGGEELRFLRYKRKGSLVDFKVWKLNCAAGRRDWVLVRHINKLKRPTTVERFAGPFFHPTNGDVVFLVWGTKVFRYMLDGSSRKYKTLSKLLKEPLVLNNEHLPCFDRLQPFPLVLPPWPTLLPNQ